MRPPFLPPFLIGPEAPRPQARNLRPLVWRSRCPHGRLGDWTATPTEDHLRIVTTCHCTCGEAS